METESRNDYYDDWLENSALLKGKENKSGKEMQIEEAIRNGLAAPGLVYPTCLTDRALGLLPDATNSLPILMCNWHTHPAQQCSEAVCHVGRRLRMGQQVTPTIP